MEKFIHPKFETKEETIVNFGSQDYFGSSDKIQRYVNKFLFYFIKPFGKNDSNRITKLINQ